MTSERPWDGLETPVQEAEVTSRRVDPDGRWDFFWAKDHQGRYSLVLRVSAPSPLEGMALPRLKSIEIAASTRDDQAFLLITLRDDSHLELFARLCRDIVEASSLAASEPQAVKTALQRAWRWHHLLRGGGDDRLTQEEQVGLVAELRFLERLMDVLPAGNAVATWRGPFEAPRDFEVGRTAVEVKSRRSSAAPRVSISSEGQLDGTGLDGLLLAVASFDRALHSGGDGVTLTEIAGRVREKTASYAPEALPDLEAALTAAGFRQEHDYSEYRWEEGKGRFFRVTDGFPRLPGSGLPLGVSEVRYVIDLRACEAYEIDEADVWTLLGEDTNV